MRFLESSGFKIEISTNQALALGTETTDLSIDIRVSTSASIMKVNKGT
jgi:hypothetical protein